MTIISDIDKEPPLRLDKEVAAKLLLCVYAYSANASARYKQYLIDGAYKDRKIAYYCNLSGRPTLQKADIWQTDQHCADRAGRIEGWSYVGAYIDTAYRYHKRFRDRPSFQKMLDDARGGKIDLIVTNEIERFTDSIYKTLELTEELRLMSPPVTVMFEKTGIDSETIHDLLMMVS